MTRTFLLLLTLVSQICIAAPPTDLDTSFRFSSNTNQSALLQLLAKRSVVFYVHNEGTISYRSTEESAVSNACSEVLKAPQISSHNVTAHEEKRFTKRLRKLGVAYGIWVKGSDRKIIWSNSDDKRALRAMQP